MMQIHPLSQPTQAASLQADESKVREPKPEVERYLDCIDKHAALRSRFLAQSLVRACKQAVERAKKSSEHSTGPSNTTVKELAVVLTFLIGLDLGGASSGTELLDFLFQTFAVLDKQLPSPPSRQIVEKLGVFAPESICDRVCASAKKEECLSQAAVAILRQNKIFETSFRTDKLKVALSNTPEAIHAQLVLNHLSDVAA
ncbi:MAG: hypothetical protein K2Y39_23630 [Candidatus Obscuribacterales bacterium]|nr:hypothetical protein [Candidatus Obscuribacterales bacterium]